MCSGTCINESSNSTYDGFLPSSDSLDQDAGSSLLGLWIFVGICSALSCIIICVAAIAIAVWKAIKEFNKTEVERN